MSFRLNRATRPGAAAKDGPVGADGANPVAIADIAVILETHRAVSVLTIFTVVPLVDLCEPWGCNALRRADQGSG